MKLLRLILLDPLRDRLRDVDRRLDQQERRDPPRDLVERVRALENGG